MGAFLAGMLTLGAAALVTSSTPPAISAEYVYSRFNNAAANQYLRYDFRMANRSNEVQTVAFCPADAEISLVDHRVRRTPAFAVSLDRKGWSHNCQSRELAVGEEMLVSLYFRPEGEGVVPRQRFGQIDIETSAGTFIFRR